MAGDGLSRRAVLALGLATAAAMAVIAGLATVGGPGTARLQRIDERRARDLVELVNAVERHRMLTGSLPASLEGLRADRAGVPDPSGQPAILDPETGEPYAYEVLAGGRFRLCMRLSLPGSPPAWTDPIRIPGSRRVASMVSDADTGRLCWQTAEPPG